MASFGRSFSGKLATGYYDKWIFIAFFAVTIGVSLYFSNLSKAWEKPSFENIVLEENTAPYLLNYQKDKGNLVITRANNPSVEVSCLTVEVDLCGRGDIPYAYNYELESAKLAFIEGTRYFDQLTYVVNKTSVNEIQTTLRNHAESRIAAYSNQQTLYIGLVGILFAMYCMYRFSTFSFKKEN